MTDDNISTPAAEAEPLPPLVGDTGWLWIRRVAALGAVLGMTLVALLLTTSAATHHRIMVPAARHRFPHWVRGVFDGLGGHMTLFRFLHLMLAMLVCWLVLYLCAEVIPVRWMVVAVVVLNAIFFLGPPILSADIFGYIDFARMGALHHLNPYVHDGGRVVSDPVHPYVRWHNTTTPYGPLFTLGSYGVTLFSVPVALWTFKSIAFVSSLGCVALVAWTARRLDRAVSPAVALFGANPILLAYAVGGGHNDLLMMLIVLGAAALVVAGKETAGAIATVAAVGLKAAAVVFAPFLWLGMRDRRRALVILALGAAAVGLVSLIAFGHSGLTGFVGVFGTSQQRQVAFHSVPNEVGRIVGAGGATSAVRHVMVAVGGAVILGLVWWVWRGADWIRGAGWAGFTVLMASAWFVSWYIIWPLAFAALSDDRRLRWATIVFSFVIVVWRFPVLSK